MGDDKMKVRVVQAFQAYKRGQEFDWPDGMARIFVARGLVEPVVEDETATVEPEVEHASVDRKPRKRRK
jgi:hypothetical protein